MEVSHLGDSQMPSGQNPGQFALDDPASEVGADHTAFRDPLQTSLCYDSVSQVGRT